MHWALWAIAVTGGASATVYLTVWLANNHPSERRMLWVAITAGAAALVLVVLLSGLWTAGHGADGLNATGGM